MKPKTIFDELVCMGNGGRYTKKYSGGEYQGMSVLQVLCAEPTMIIKNDAPWIIPSTYKSSDARVHNAQLLKGRYCLLAVDIDTGNHPFETIKGIVTRNLPEIACRIYSSSSAKSDDRKWRVLIPVTKPLQATEWVIWQKALGEIFKGAGVVVDEALYRTGQLVFLPNVPESKRDENGIPFFYQSELFGNDELDTSCSSWSDALAKVRLLEVADFDKKEQLLQARQARPAIGGGDSIISRFNAQYSIQQLLIEYGYENNPGTNDWRSKYQSGESFATRDFGNYWVSLSQSDVDAGLGMKTLQGCSGDAFDLYAHFEFRGDYKRAAKELL